MGWASVLAENARRREAATEMNRTDLQTLSRLRQGEARTLLNAGQYAGAYYLAGQSVECALKACVARLTQRFAFPNKEFALQAYSHKLPPLLKLAGLDPALAADAKTNPQLDINWSVVKDWDVDSRYDVAISAGLAKDMYTACAARRNGVLTWIRQRW
jgi:hypothetical protein